MKNTPISKVEQSQDLTSKSLKISKQVILEQYHKDTMATYTSQNEAMAKLSACLEAHNYEDLQQFSNTLDKYITDRAKLLVCDTSEMTRLRNLLNKLLDCSLLKNTDMFEFPTPRTGLPTNLVRTINDSSYTNLIKEFVLVEGTGACYVYTYTYEERIIVAAELEERQLGNDYVEDCFSSFELEVAIPSSYGAVIASIIEYSKICKELIYKRETITTKVSNIDTHLEKLEAQLLVKELQDAGNTEALDTIQSIIQSATGNNELLLGTK